VGFETQIFLILPVRWACSIATARTASPHAAGSRLSAASSIPLRARYDCLYLDEEGV